MGGECLLVDYKSSQYLGGLPPVALPGELASRQPWHFRIVYNLSPSGKAERCLFNVILARLTKAIDKGINSPTAIYWAAFDAVAAALGICTAQTSWEGEAACQLAIAMKSPVSTSGDYAVSWSTIRFTYIWQQWMAYCTPKPQRTCISCSVSGRFC